MNNLLKIRLVAFVLLFSLTTLYAQPSRGNPGANPAPFGFVEVLLLAGAGYGGKKVYDRSCSNNP